MMKTINVIIREYSKVAVLAAVHANLPSESSQHDIYKVGNILKFFVSVEF